MLLIYSKTPKIILLYDQSVDRSVLRKLNLFVIINMIQTYLKSVSIILIIKN